MLAQFTLCHSDSHVLTVQHNTFLVIVMDLTTYSSLPSSLTVVCHLTYELNITVSLCCLMVYTMFLFVQFTSDIVIVCDGGCYHLVIYQLTIPTLYLLSLGTADLYITYCCFPRLLSVIIIVRFWLLQQTHVGHTTLPMGHIPRHTPSWLPCKGWSKSHFRVIFTNKAQFSFLNLKKIKVKISHIWVYFLKI